MLLDLISKVLEEMTVLSLPELGFLYPGRLSECLS